MGLETQMSPALYLDSLRRAPLVIIEVVDGCEGVKKKHRGLKTHLRLESPVRHHQVIGVV